MYGVIFIIEEISFTKNSSNKSEKTDKDDDLQTEEVVETSNNELNVLNADLASTDNLSKSELELKEESKSVDDSLSSKKFGIFGPFLGQLIGTVKDCCRKAFLNGEPRLYEAIYLCLFQIRQEYVGKIHSVVSRRRGTIINELSNDESIVVTIEAVVPVVESFGFVEEIRKNTSGMANPMLQFFKWQMIDVDPFYVPITQEVLDNFGANIDTPNLAKNYINKIRLRKGLPIDEKIVKSSDKQKNLSKKR
jgi:ribosome assembly protein 1